MASQYLTDLIARRDAVAGELATINAAKPGGLPNSSGGGDSPDHQGYKRGLYDELKELDALIEAQRAREGEAAGPKPFFVVSEGR